jgi:hypothetical protein
MYLSPDQLANLIECSPSSFACMCRWLDRNKWPYVKSITGFPKVTRDYHDIRLNGSSILVVAEQEPNYRAFL